MAVQRQAEAPLKRHDMESIVKLAEKRIRNAVFQARDAAYDVMRLYYFGDSPSEGSIEVLASNSQGRPLLRDLEKYTERARAYSSQRLAPIVDDYQALVGRMPNSRVEPPDSSPEGETKAELLTKYLVSTHEISDMTRQQADAGFHLPGLGDACYIFTPNGDKHDPNYRRVVWEVVNPRYAYPSYYRGHRRFQLYDLVIQKTEAPEVIEQTWDITPRSDQEVDTTVTTYISPFQRSIVVGLGKHVEMPVHAEWDLGFCPAQWVYNKVNGQFAQSDIAHSLSQQDFLDFAYNILIDGLVRNTYGTIVSIRNPRGEGNIVLGPNPPVVELDQDGAVTATQVGGDPSPAMKMIDQTIGDINASTGTSQVRQEGQMHGSIQTGRAIHAAQGPQSTRIDLKQDNLGSAIRNANSMTLQLQEKAPGLKDHEFEIFGRYKGKSFRQTMTGKDIDGWYRNAVTWDALVGMNMQQKAQVAYELEVAELIDDIGARELVGVDDPIGMRERIRAMKIHKAQVEAEVQQIMGGQGGAPGSAPGQPTPASGGTPSPPSGAAPPAQMIRRPPGLAAGAPGPPAAAPPPGMPMTGISRQKIEAALRLVAGKLKGTVFVVGELAASGQAMRPQLLVSEWKDQPLVMQVLKPMAPNVEVKAVSEAEMPADAVRVA